MESDILKSVCEECGKEFEGANAKGMLAGHMKTHAARKRTNTQDEKRKDRVPLGMPQRKFSCPSDDDFHYRIVNDNWSKEPGRVQRAQEGGWEIVEKHDPIAVGTNEDGSAIKGILMRIPQEMYDEDQKGKQKEVDKVDDQIKGGTLEQKQSDKRYSPSGIRVWSSKDENG
jgi:hypothetical protein